MTVAGRGGGRPRRWAARARAVGLWVGLGVAGLWGCGPGEIPLWEAPEGAELLGEYWGLRVYQVAGARMCGGAVARAGRQWRALLDLLGLSTLDGMVLLYDENTKEEVDGWCGRVLSCGAAYGAVTSTGALTHELSHHAVRRALGWTYTSAPPYVVEGVATLLSGMGGLDYRMYWGDDPEDDSVPDLEALLHRIGLSNTEYNRAAHFAAWLFYEHGAERTFELLDALYEPGDSREEELELMVEHLGYESFSALEDAYLWGSGWRYPQLVDTDERYEVSDLERGVPWLESCSEGEGRGTEGRLPRPGTTLSSLPSEATTSRLHSALVWLDRGAYGYVMEDDWDEGSYGVFRSPYRALEEPMWEFGFPEEGDVEYCGKGQDTWATMTLEVENPGWYRVLEKRQESTLAGYGAARPRLWIWRRGESCEDPNFRVYPPGGVPPPGSFPGP